MFEEFTQPDESRRAFAQLLKKVAKRDHSEFEMRVYLKRRELVEADIERAISELREMNGVDDERFARAYTIELFRKDYGPNRISQKLSERGVDRSYWQILEYFSEGFDINQAEFQAWELNKVIELCEKKLRIHPDRYSFSDGKTKFEARAKLARFLESRGYSKDSIMKAISQCLR